ncbi:hypothetical protein LOAG_11475 [Loa loa]|uniref:Uncharacterized protein n=1 Tax=Loa loa TaxID=7209 RepID=A0A1S0TP55_LOALO|nr:hypothetical protein LOAG_11475 [Loa loa]EFO17029.2 hypothetical protein LOAG_11475 [Loa loa]
MYHIIIFLLLLLLHKSVLSKSVDEEEEGVSNVLNDHFYDGNKIILPLSKNASIQLLNHWIQQAASGFIAAFASKRMKMFKHQNDEKFYHCSKEANSITKHAKCAVDLLMLEKMKQIKIRKFGNVKRKYEMLKYFPIRKINARKPDAKIDRNRKYMSKANDYWIGKFRIARQKRAVEKTKWKIKRINKKSYHLLTDKDTKTTFGMIISGVKKILQKLKRQKTSKTWSTTIAEIQHLAMQMKEREELLKMFEIKAQNNGIKISHVLKILIDPRRKMKLRPNRTQLLAKSFSTLLRNGAMLAIAMSNKSISNMHNKTIRIASPRFFSILPDDNKQNTVNLLSPSILSLHNEGDSMERKLSISGLLGAFKLMNEYDQNELLELITEASGLTDAIQQIHEKLEMENNNIRHAKGINGQPLYFTKQNVSELYGEIERNKVDIFERLYKTLSKQQIGEINVTGYAVLSKRQLKLIYGQRSPYYHPIALKKLKSLENDLKKLAKSENFGLQTGELHRRQKRSGISLSPFLLSPFILAGGSLSQPVLLSPVVLSPVILSPAILGPFILSPWIFNPVILSPRILAPFILNPFIFSPIILSPVALHPFILSPGIFNPVILSPLALSPFILSPQVATPLILSPMILNPLLLNPMALSPLVFSPFILSPLVYSPQYLFALVFSPYMLSPIIESELINSTCTGSLYVRDVQQIIFYYRLDTKYSEDMFK